MLPTSASLGLQAFKDFAFDKIKTQVVSAMLQQVNKEREGQIIDGTLLKRCVEVFEAMGKGELDCYIQDFEVKNSALSFYLFDSFFFFFLFEWESI